MKLNQESSSANSTLDPRIYWSTKLNNIDRQELPDGPVLPFVDPDIAACDLWTFGTMDYSGNSTNPINLDKDFPTLHESRNQSMSMVLRGPQDLNVNNTRLFPVSRDEPTTTTTANQNPGNSANPINLDKDFPTLHELRIQSMNMDSRGPQDLNINNTRLFPVSRDESTVTTTANQNPGNSANPINLDKDFPTLHELRIQSMNMDSRGPQDLNINNTRLFPVSRDESTTTTTANQNPGNSANPINLDKDFPTLHELRIQSMNMDSRGPQDLNINNTRLFPVSRDESTTTTTANQNPGNSANPINLEKDFPTLHELRIQSMSMDSRGPQYLNINNTQLFPVSRDEHTTTTTNQNLGINNNTDFVVDSGNNGWFLESDRQSDFQMIQLGNIDGRGRGRGPLDWQHVCRKRKRKIIDSRGPQDLKINDTQLFPVSRDNHTATTTTNQNLGINNNTDFVVDSGNNGWFLESGSRSDLELIQLGNDDGRGRGGGPLDRQHICRKRKRKRKIIDSRGPQDLNINNTQQFPVSRDNHTAITTTNQNLRINNNTDFVVDSGSNGWFLESGSQSDLQMIQLGNDDGRGRGRGLLDRQHVCRKRKIFEEPSGTGQSSSPDRNGKCFFQGEGSSRQQMVVSSTDTLNSNLNIFSGNPDPGSSSIEGAIPNFTDRRHATSRRIRRRFNHTSSQHNPDMFLPSISLTQHTNAWPEVNQSPPPPSVSEFTVSIPVSQTQSNAPTNSPLLQNTHTFLCNGSQVATSLGLQPQTLGNLHIPAMFSSCLGHDPTHWDLSTSLSSRDRHRFHFILPPPCQPAPALTPMLSLPHNQPSLPPVPVQCPFTYSEIVRRSVPSSGSDTSNVLLREPSNTNSSNTLPAPPPLLALGIAPPNLEPHRNWHLMRSDFLGPYLSLQTSTSLRERRTRMLSEIRNVLEEFQGSRDNNMQMESMVFGGVEWYHDRHRDMRLDVDNMTYEDLLALEERIGNVSIGLSEEKVSKHLKHSKYTDDAISNEAVEPCCICQEEYEKDDDLGTLDCSHLFHSSCIKRWLFVKNECPICKIKGLAT